VWRRSKTPLQLRHQCVRQATPDTFHRVRHHCLALSDTLAKAHSSLDSPHAASASTLVSATSLNSSSSSTRRLSTM
jgi:hypothetical protein